MAKRAIWVERVRPEAELLLCCARKEIDTDTAERIRDLLRQGIDWQLFREMVGRNRLVPLACRHLAAVCPQAVPRDIRDWLFQAACVVAQRNLLATAALGDLLDLLASHGIAAIAFKGPVLAAMVYGDVLLRSFDDLDILIHPRDVLRAQNLLIAWGLEPLFAPPRTRKAVAVQKEQVFRDPAINLLVDLHWSHPLDALSPAVDPAELWQRLEPVVVERREFLTLSRRDLLPALCIHGSKHCWERLVWVCDIAQVARSCNDADWRWILDCAASLRCTRMLLLGLSVAEALLAVTLPDEITHRISSDPVVGTLTETACLDVLGLSRGPTQPWGRRGFQLALIEGLPSKLRYGIGMVFKPTPCEWGLVRFPDRLFALYFVVRPLRLAMKYLLAPCKRLALRFRMRGPPKGKVRSCLEQPGTVNHTKSAKGSR